MDPQGFEELYRANYKLLRNAARQLTGDGDAAHDLVQEVFLKLWKKKHEMDAILNAQAYLYRAVVNASLNHLEQNKRRRTTDDLRLPSDMSSDAGLDLKELQQRIQVAMDRLPPRCRAVFVLSRLEDKKNKEIASLLGLSLKTVENQMGIALKKMREELRPYIQKDIFALSALGGLTSLLAALGQIC